MQIFSGLLAIALIGVIISINLLPYYLAYLLIDPSGFMGMVGVFILGSIIIPMTYSVSIIIFSMIAKAFGR
ncbi:hypothetical protein J7554_02840 [Wohlfahrtiimonas chitiniclastica]|uniref:hypothetical protein n=1 Tax=Wohlfahrtiimonas chitiniclastica TaxID=400946 RepID=UPI0007B69C3D|nr:hypothetical protein [Wohlfahrtiimonas chitiniclastica]KZX37112.1 hypothetical protein A6V30_05355 [Wohlfahrtiimonas chitiniclastica]MBS7828061.1 hypothetical protein [Wohlfahrtiimonas chitiniclastica]